MRPTTRRYGARGASPRSAVAAAAYTTLAYYFPTLAPSLVSTYTDYLNVTLAKVPEKARLDGVAVGTAAAGQLITSRFGDGRNAPVATAFGVAPQPAGTWVFAPPPSAQSAQTPWVAAMKPFMLTSADQFRAPAAAGDRRARICAAVNEVRRWAARRIAHALRRRPRPPGSGTRTPSTSTTRSSATSQPTAASTSSTPSGLLAMGDMVGADAGIACMDSKYHYLLWRPVTAIRKRRPGQQRRNDA